MTTQKLTLPALALALLVGAGGALSLAPVPAQAQAGNPPPPAAAQPQPPRPRPMRPSHIDGRIAYMKAELKITPDQEAAFDKVAQVLRQNDTERRQAFEQARANFGKPQSALQHMEAISRMSAMRAQDTDRLLAAFRPLYDGLSDAQKKTADDLMGFHGFHHGFRGRR